MLIQIAYHGIINIWPGNKTNQPNPAQICLLPVASIAFASIAFASISVAVVAVAVADIVLFA